MRSLFVAAVLAAPLCAQYTVQSAGAPPADVPSAFSAMLQTDGSKVVAGNGSVVCEIWFRKAVPSGPKSTEDGVSLPTIPHGSLMGVVRYPVKGEDRRGQGLKAGIYTLRYSMHPVNGDHLGVAPQRDFLVISPAAEDKDPAASPKFEELVNMSKKASGTPHPAVLSMSPSSHGKFPDLAKEGDTDWVLHVKLGDMPVAVIVVGRAEG